MTPSTRANRDLAGFDLHDVAIVRSPNFEPALEQGNRAIRLHGDVELRAFDDGDEPRVSRRGACRDRAARRRRKTLPRCWTSRAIRLPSTASAGISTSVSFATLTLVPACVRPTLPSWPVTMQAGKSTVVFGATLTELPAIVKSTSPPTAVTGDPRAVGIAHGIRAGVRARGND
jgi:hypothetical protein